MQTRIKEKLALYRFESIAELGAYAKDAPRTWRNERLSVDHSPSQSWDLNTSYNDAVRLAVGGWNEGAQRAAQALKEFAPRDIAPDTRIDFYGYRPHVARFCAGAPDCMIRHTRDEAESGTGRVLTLIVETGANAYVGAEHMANFGLGVTQYIDHLEMQDTRVELMGCMSAVISGWRVAYSWVIKHADQPLDLSVTAFAVGHPAMLRRLGFALDERSAAPETPGYGSVVDAKLSDVINAPEGAVILSGMARADRHARTPQAGLDYVERTINQLLEDQE